MFGDFIDFDDDEDQEHGHAHGHQQGQGQEEERSRQQQQQRYYIGDQLAIGAFGIVPFSPTIVSVVCDYDSVSTADAIPPPSLYATCITVDDTLLTIGTMHLYLHYESVLSVV